MAVTLAPGISRRPTSSTGNVIQPTNDDSNGLRIRGHSPTQNAEPFKVETSAGDPLFVVDPFGQTTFTTAPYSFENIIFQFVDGVAGPFAALVQVLRSGLGASYGIWEMFAQNDTDCLIQLYGHSASHSANFLEVYADGSSIATTINGKGDLSVGTALVAEAGVTPKIGFLGAATAVRQTNGTAANLAAITDPAAKAFLTALSAGLVNLGLFASPA